MARQLFEGAVTVALIGGKGGPIGRKADVALAGRALAVAQVAGEFLYGVVLLAPQVAFELKHRAPEKRVDAAPHLGHRLLEVDIGACDAKPIHQHAVDQHAHLLMARAGRKFGDSGSKIGQGRQPRLSG